MYLTKMEMVSQSDNMSPFPVTNPKRKKFKESQSDNMSLSLPPSSLSSEYQKEKKVHLTQYFLSS